MRSVVTGGSGFIGSFVVEYLAAENPDNKITIFDLARPSFVLPPNVTYFEGDTRYTASLLAAIVPGTDEVYDLAGILGTSELITDTERAIDVNVKGAANVLEVCRQRSVARVFRPTKPNEWLNTYSISKYGAEQLALMYVKEYGMSVAVTKWFNAFGGRQHLWPVRKMLPLFVVQALRGLPLEVYGDGSQTVDMIYVGDIARIAVLATRHPTLGRSGKVLDVGSGVAISVNAMAEKIIKMCNSSSPIRHLPMRAGEPERSEIKADVTALREYIDYGQMMDLDEGLRRSIEYYAALPAEEVDRALDHFKIKREIHTATGHWSVQ